MPQFMIAVNGVEQVAEEDVSKRTLNGKVGTLPNGDRVIQLQPGTHYWDRDAGAYLDCDSTIQPDETVPGFTHNVKAGLARVRLATGGRFRFGLKHPLFVTYSPRAAAAVIPAVIGNKATFSGLWPGAAVELEKSPERVKETLILADASAPSSYTWDLEEFVGVVPTMEADGSLSYVETVTGQVIGGIPAPTVHDADGVPGPVTMTYESGAITTAIDPAWLADPDRPFPVTLDPSTVTLQPGSAGMDAFLDTAYPDTNFGTDTRLELGSNSATFEFVEQWDLSSVGRTHIISASLQLKHYATDGTYSAGQTRTADVKRISGGAWSEGTVTWNNCPTVGATVRASATFAVDAFPQWVSWDITALVNEWLNGTYLNYGLRMTSSAGYGAPNFYSSDWPTAADRPKLVITLTAVPTVSTTSPTGTSGSPGSVTNDVTPALSGVYSSTDAINMAKKRHQVYDAANNLVWDSGEVVESAAPGAAVSATVPAGLLKYGQTYSWRWMAIDANGAYSSWSALTYFKSVMSAPTGLGATPNPGSARIDLSWAPHAGENLAGYRVYRREAGALTWGLFSIGTVAAVTVDAYYFLNAQQISLVTETQYHDRIPETGITYEYQATAVATDGYESPASATASATVTVTGFWIDDTAVHPTEEPVFEYPRRASSRVGTGGSYLIQDLGLLGRRISLSLRFRSRAERDAIIALFSPGHQISYRDEDGNTFRGAVTDSISEQRTKHTNGFYGVLQFEAAEVSAA